MNLLCVCDDELMGDQSEKSHEVHQGRVVHQEHSEAASLQRERADVNEHEFRIWQNQRKEIEFSGSFFPSHFSGSFFRVIFQGHFSGSLFKGHFSRVIFQVISGRFNNFSILSEMVK